MCSGDRELPASFLHELVSPSVGAADCSMAAPGPMLPLCPDLTSLDYHHNIHQLSSTRPPSPSPCRYPLPAPSAIPPAGSSLNDTLSICLIISPTWPVLLGGRSRGAGGSSTGLPDCSHGKAALSVTRPALHCQVQNSGPQKEDASVDADKGVSCVYAIDIPAPSPRPLCRGPGPLPRPVASSSPAGAAQSLGCSERSRPLTETIALI
ncbi:hypothetical protein EYF80_051362 [Liparis tanakae]|uniref:Uncharacterized protein n=1 Tax=Liparis tanakae TaxID=230148 RepID=A0A4Z2FC56_9TELE|nr:hypothetical protein EYF80_051362 [Liparis tanakae]